MSGCSRVAIDDKTIDVEVISLTIVSPGDTTLNVDDADSVYIY
ncbi:MAG: hypothetical protein AAFW95_01225 [Cyanobacteria bacterium J06638_6]